MAFALLAVICTFFFGYVAICSAYTLDPIYSCRQECHGEVAEPNKSPFSIGRQCGHVTDGKCLKCFLSPSDSDGTGKLNFTTVSSGVQLLTLSGGSEGVQIDLAEIGKFFPQLRCLKIIDFKQIPANIPIDQVELLNVEGIPIANISDLLSCSTNHLKRLSIKSNGKDFSVFTPCSDLYGELEELQLFRTLLVDAAYVSAFAGLKRLFLNDNGLLSLENVVPSKLNELVVWSNAISPLADHSLAGLDSLTLLTYQGIECPNNFDVAWCKSFEKSIRSLMISCFSPPTDSVKLSDVLPCSTPALEDLAINNFNINDLTPAASFPKLEKLELENNALVDVAALAKKVPKLSELLLGSNKFTDFEIFINSDFTKLETLDLSFNEISALPEPRLTADQAKACCNLLAPARVRKQEVCNSAFCKLRTLRLGSRISSIEKEWFFPFPNLNRLDLTENLIASLPESAFEFLCKLTAIDLSGNRLSTIPETLFCNTTAIESINIGRNKFSAIPNTLCSLADLQKIVATENNVTSFPSCTATKPWPKMAMISAGSRIGGAPNLGIQHLCDTMSKFNGKVEFVGEAKCDVAATKSIYCCKSSRNIDAKCAEKSVSAECRDLFDLHEVMQCYEKQGVLNTDMCHETETAA